MTISSEQLILDLIECTRLNINQAETFSHLSQTNLNQKLAPKSWSILECLEHLNLYGDYYIPEITRSIQGCKKPWKSEFKSGLLGNYFAKMMRPSESMKTMKTFKSKNPLGSNLTKNVIIRFIEQQQQILELLDKARHVDLNKTKTGVSISKWIKLQLGDTFRVVIYHNERHILQAKHVLNSNNPM